jgi:hypothetical protein
MRSMIFTMLFLASMCYALPCPDPQQRQVEIRGDAIDGNVLLLSKPLKSVKIRLYSPTRRTTWTGTTDKEGNFHIRDLRPDLYRLTIRGWGTTRIRLAPKSVEQFPASYPALCNTRTQPHQEMDSALSRSRWPRNSL